MPFIDVSLILFGVGIVAGILNVTAGGGSMFTVPVLIFLGVDPLVANGTNRIGVFFQNLLAIGSFKYQKKTDIRTSLKLATAAVPGALLGAFIASRVSSQEFKTVLPVILIFSSSTLFIPSSKLEKLTFTRQGRWFAFPILFLIGLYGGFIQIGVGFLFMAGLRTLFSMDLVTVSSHKVAIVFLYTIPALAIFLWSGQVNIILGLILAAGTSAGALIGTRIAVKGGESWIRIIVVIAVIAISTKLIWDVI